MDVLREREVKDSLERQLQDEQKIRVMMQKRLRKERRARRRLQEQLEMEVKRRVQLEDALKASGASVEALRILNESATPEQHRVGSSNSAGGGGTSTPGPRDPVSEPRSETPPYVPRDQPPPPPDKAWNYAGLDLMSSGAAFWQNYSETLAQELEMERKSRQQQAEKDVKSPLQDRPSYYKNSVLFTSAT